MKKLIPIMIVILLVLQLCVPYISYAKESIKNTNTQNNNVTEDKGESEQDEDNINSNNIIDNSTINSNTTNKENNTNKIENNNIINNSNTNKIENNNIVNNSNTNKLENNKIDNKVEENKIEKKEKEEKENLEEKKLKESERLEEGRYKILMATNPSQSLTVDGGKIENGANVHLWEYVNSEQQKFEIKYDKEGYCEIIPVHSKKRLDVVGWGNEANIDQWEENGGSDNQKWIIRRSERGNYNIISKRQNLYLDAYQSKIQNGTNIQAYEKSGGNGQEFKLEKIKEEEKPHKTVEEGTYKIVMAIAPTQSLTVDGGKREDGANVHIWEYVNVPQQQFNLVYDGEGYYEIIPVNSGKRLDVVGWGNEANVDQWGSNGGNDNQKWQIKKSERGNYNIISKRENLYLDAYHSKTEDGTNIEVYEKSGGNGQEFKLEKISNRSEKTVKDGIYKLSPSLNTNMVVEASASNTDNNGRIQIWQNYNAPAQKLSFKYENGYYKISLNHSGKYLTVEDGRILKNVDIVQEEWKNQSNQKWIVRENKENSWEISLLGNPEFSISVEGKIENGSKLILDENKTTNNQQFYLENLEKYIVVLNAGHGGSEIGCANGWVREKDITLQIARKIRDRLSAYPQVKVIMTRDGDYDIDLNTRAMTAWNNRADLYVSLHINDEASHRSTGSEIFVPWYEGEKHYNSKMRYLSRLIQDNLSKIGIGANKYGGTVKRNIDWEPKYQYLVNGKVERADYYEDIRDAMKGDKEGRGTDLSLGMGIPTILVEHCYMNSSDFNHLNEYWKVDQIGDADANAIIEYLGI